MGTLLIVLAVILGIGVIVNFGLALFAPTRLVTKEGAFRYDVVLAILVFWWISIIAVMFWPLFYGLKKIIYRKVTPNK